jgi:uncharacterized protein YdiU (UPF0061 family)
VTTGEVVRRERALPGAVLTRVAASHIRIGTFQFFAARGDNDAVRNLADHVIDRHYPDVAKAPKPYRALLEGVIARQADLVARWLHVGFIHGVMNTDNMSIAGETIDYGPCAFVDAYDPATVFSSIDQHGRYAYANQPAIAQWNLVRLAECLLPLLAEDEDAAVEEAKAALASFGEIFNRAYVAGLRAKLGLFEEQEGDFALGQDLLKRMAASKADFTLTFRRLADAASDPEHDEAVRSLFEDPSAFDEWATAWRLRLGAEPQKSTERRAAMRRVSPAFIPRNHRVEVVIAAAVDEENFAPFEELLAVLAAPYDDQPAFAGYADPPPAGGGAYRTFCGT